MKKHLRDWIMADLFGVLLALAAAILFAAWLTGRLG